jgi:hypothetical protein
MGVASSTHTTSVLTPRSPPLTFPTPLLSQMCCAWDVYITMGADGSIPTATHQDPKIPAVFVTMADSDLLLQVHTNHHTHLGDTKAHR